MKANQIFALLFSVLLIDISLSATLLPVSVQLLSHQDVGVNNHSPVIFNNLVFASGILFLLSPTYLIIALLTGWLCDTIGHKKALLLSFVLALSGYILLFISNNWHSILFALLGILLINADSSMVVTQSFAIDISQGKKRAYYLGLIVFIMLPLYLAVSDGVNKYFSSLSTLVYARNILIVSAIIITILNIIIANLLLPKINIIKKCIINNLELYYTLQRIFMNSRIMLLFLLLGLIQFSSGLYSEAIAKYITLGFDHPNYSINLLDGSNILVSSLFLIIIYPLVIRYFDLKKILFFTMIIFLLAILLSLFTSNPLVLWMFSLIVFVCTGFGIALIWMLLSIYAEVQDTGFIMGIKATIWGLAWAFSVTIGHTLSDYFSLISPIQFATAIASLALLIVSFINKHNLNFN